MNTVCHSNHEEKLHSGASHGCGNQYNSPRLKNGVKLVQTGHKLLSIDQIPIMRGPEAAFFPAVAYMWPIKWAWEF